MDKEKGIWGSRETFAHSFMILGTVRTGVLWDFAENPITMLAGIVEQIKPIL